jgi:hypothetical protein
MAVAVCKEMARHVAGNHILANVASAHQAEVVANADALLAG